MLCTHTLLKYNARIEERLKIVRKIFANVNYYSDICSVESLRVVLYYISKKLYI